MKTRVLSGFVLLMSVLLLAAACQSKKEAQGADVTTQTVAPAAAQPDTSGTDAMTQTVDLGDSRSEEDGGTSTIHEGALRPMTATTATSTAPPAAAKVPPHKKK